MNNINRNNGIYFKWKSNKESSNYGRDDDKRVKNIEALDIKAWKMRPCNENKENKVKGASWPE